MSFHVDWYEDLYKGYAEDKWQIDPNFVKKKVLSF